MSDFLNNRGNYQLRFPFEHYLDTNGDGTGAYNAIGDYSGATPTDFYYQPPVGSTVNIAKLIIHLADKGSFSFDGYGAIGAGQVTVGLRVLIERQGQIALDLTNGKPIINNASMSHLNTDYRLINFSNNHDASSVSFDTNSFGAQLQMHGDLGDRIIVRLNDDFTGLNEQHFIIYGTE